ncbi:MAG: hypothetical protein CM1200mP36_03270 [Gammaproteobacteria bacterium]|nr:MAG: hypothetical protein CM1200mP36_03270 [Gammaproteobacteria bacterium]
MIELGLKFTAAYLLGSILGSLVWGSSAAGSTFVSSEPQRRGDECISDPGQGIRSVGDVIDVGKGVIPVLLLLQCDSGVGLDAQVSRELITYLSGSVQFSATYTHCGMPSAGQRWGKPRRCPFRASPWLALPAIGIWFAVIVVTRYVGLAL